MRTLTPAQRERKRKNAQADYRKNREKRIRENMARNAEYAQSQDRTVPNGGKEKSRRIDLGIALLHQVALPGVRYTLQEQAEWAGCRHQAIQQIYTRALRKLQDALKADRETMELLEFTLSRETEDRPDPFKFRTRAYKS